ncbi:MAG TPA: STAS domain-containing protein [Gaiellales bacterium]
MPAPFQIDCERDGFRAIVRCSGEVDQATADTLTQVLGDAMSSDAAELVVDMTEVSFLDSTGLQRVIMGATQCEALGLPFTLETSDWVERMLEIAGVRDIVHGRL